ncbi:MAG: hypothetical protein KA775_04410 [Ottowia sp.]|nr:hypothetical protein [Ottowia sp.]
MEGTLDTSFNPPAITGNNWVPFGGVQSSGKVLVALNGSGGQNGTIGAETNSGLIRLNEDGSIDGSWNGRNNWQNTGGYIVPDGILVLPDDKVLVWFAASVARPPPNPNRNATRMVRLNSDGTIDSSFPTVDFFRGMTFTPLSVVIDYAGNYVCCAKSAGVALNEGVESGIATDMHRISPAGVLDTGVVPVIGGGSASFTKGAVYTCLPLPDGKILALGGYGGYSAGGGLTVDGTRLNRTGATRLNSDFTYDATFGGNSTFSGGGTDGPNFHGGFVMPDGRYLLYGAFTQLQYSNNTGVTEDMALLDTGGTRLTFPATAGGHNAAIKARLDGGNSNLELNGLALTSDGKIYGHGTGWPFRLIYSSASEDPTWDNRIVMSSYPLGTPGQNYPRGMRMYLSHNEKKLVVMGRAGGAPAYLGPDVVGADPVQRILRLDVGPPPQGTGDGTIVLMADNPPLPVPLNGDGTIALEALDSYGPEAIMPAYGSGTIHLLGSGNDVPEPLWEYLTEWLGAGDDEWNLPKYGIIEALGAGGQTSTTFIGLSLATEKLELGDALAVVLRELLAEGFIFDAEPAYNFRAMAHVADALRLSGVAGSQLEALNIIAAAIGLGVLLRQRDIHILLDGMKLDDALTSAVRLGASLVDALLLEAETTPVVVFTALVNEGFELGAGATTILQAIEALREGVSFALHLNLDDGQYSAYVINTESKGVTQYAHYPFNSFARLGDRYLGMTPDGIRELEGPDDAGSPIAARFRLAMSRLGTGQLKRMVAAYLGYSSTGDLRLKTITIQPDGVKRADHYRLLAQPGAPREARIKVGQGLRSVYWGFEVEAIGGAAFAIDLIELQPIVVEQRIQGQGGGKR